MVPCACVVGLSYHPPTRGLARTAAALWPARWGETGPRSAAPVCFLSPLSYTQISMLGFENHLNVFHCSKQGIPENLARGLVVFLNSTVVDEHFRRFSGH